MQYQKDVNAKCILNTKNWMAIRHWIVLSKNRRIDTNKLHDNHNSTNAPKFQPKLFHLATNFNIVLKSKVIPKIGLSDRIC